MHFKEEIVTKISTNPLYFLLILILFWLRQHFHCVRYTQKANWPILKLFGTFYHSNVVRNSLEEFYFELVSHSEMERQYVSAYYKEDLFFLSTRHERRIKYSTRIIRYSWILCTLSFVALFQRISIRCFSSRVSESNFHRLKEGDSRLLPVVHFSYVYADTPPLFHPLATGEELWILNPPGLYHNYGNKGSAVTPC